MCAKIMKKVKGISEWRYAYFTHFLKQSRPLTEKAKMLGTCSRVHIYNALLIVAPTVSPSTTELLYKCIYL